MEEADPPTLTSRDIEQYCGVTDRTIRYWRKRGVIPEPLKTVTGRLRWRRSVLDTLLKRPDGKAGAS